MLVIVRDILIQDYPQVPRPGLVREINAELGNAMHGSVSNRTGINRPQQRDELPCLRGSVANAPAVSGRTG
jgi:hypothetical protein